MSKNLDNNKITKDLTQALSSGLLDVFLERQGNKILAQEIETLIGSNAPGGYTPVIKALAAAAPKDFALAALDLKEVGSDFIRGRLERALKVFGGRRVYETVVRLQSEKVADIVDSNLRVLMNKTPLKEIYSWTGTRQEDHEPINLSKVKDKYTREVIEDLIRLYGDDVVARRIEDISSRQASARLNILLEAQGTSVDPVKAFIQHRDNINKTASRRHGRERGN